MVVVLLGHLEHCVFVIVASGSVVRLHASVGVLTWIVSADMRSWHFEVRLSNW